MHYKKIKLCAIAIFHVGVAARLKREKRIIN